MVTTIRLELGDGKGWIEFKVRDQFRSVSLVASDVTNGPESLVQAAIDVVLGANVAEASFEAEPTNYRWRLRQRGPDVVVDIRAAPEWETPEETGKLVWSTAAPPRSFAAAVLECFDDAERRYGAASFERQWGRPLPSELANRRARVLRAVGMGALRRRRVPGSRATAEGATHGSDMTLTFR